MVYVPAPWTGESLPVDDGQQRHLVKVLRKRPGETIQYTDGLGIAGTGTLDTQGILRGNERSVRRSSNVAVYLAAPKAKERQRFAVEKLVEIGVATIGWLDTVHGEGRAIRPEKAQSWAISALEQSRGAWLPTLRDRCHIAEILDWHSRVVAADQGGRRDIAGGSEVALLVGPEAGWADGELPESVERMSLADSVLRTETAALVGAVHLLYS